MGCSCTRRNPYSLRGIPGSAAFGSPLTAVRIQPSAFITKRNSQLRADYTLGQKIGEGGFAFVRIAVHGKTGQTRAVKTIQKSKLSKSLKDRSQFFTEIDILKRTDHPNIVKLYEFYEDPFHYHLVTEYLAGGALFDFVKKHGSLSEHTAAFYMRQILSGVAYCHSKGIVHRDLKPENLLLTSQAQGSTLKIIDFGTSAFFAEDPLTDAFGSSYYVAPEVLNEHYNEKCDVWSCGVVLYTLLSGTVPFKGQDDSDTLRCVRSGEYTFSGSAWRRVSTQAKQLIQAMLEYQPDKRISAEAALNHPWVVGRTESTVSASIDSSISNLQRFHVTIKFQQAVLAFIAHQLVSQRHTEKLAQLFRQLDENGDGKLSRAELFKAFSQSMEASVAAAEVERVFNQIDIDHSGFIDYTEFIMGSADSANMLSAQNLEAAFEEFDCDRDGKISASELKQIFGTAQGEQVPEEVWQELILEADENGDGEIDLREFKALMKKVLSSASKTPRL